MRDAISPEYDDCPANCVFNPTENKFSFCQNCPVGIAKKEFETAAVDELEIKCAAALKKYSFKTFYETILNVADLKTLPENRQSVRLTQLINILEAETRRVDRIREWIRRQNKPD